MSYQTEHKRLKPVLDVARLLDIATNPEKKAIFEAGSAGFQVWCTPEDHPQGWQGLKMIPGTFSKPCEYVGSVHWKWDEERISALEIETSAYALAEQRSDRYTNLPQPPRGDPRRSIYNRPEDIAWLVEKTAWLFQEAGVELPPCEYERETNPDLVPHHLVHYVSKQEDYLVIVSPDQNPLDYCEEGFEIGQVLDLWGAAALPTNSPLVPISRLTIPRPSQPEPEPEPDEGVLVEQYENASRLGEDDWLEADFEDRISGLFAD